MPHDEAIDTCTRHGGNIMQDKPNVLLSDLDGVYVDWTQGFVKYMESIGFKALHAQPEVFTMTDIFPDVEKPWLHIKDYQQSEFYAQVKAYDGALEAYKHLVDNGVKIIAVSSCGLDEQTVKSRTAFVESQGVFSDMILLEMGAPKIDVLNSFDRSAFIDDQPVIAMEGLEAGHIAMLKAMPYNADVSLKNINRIVDLSEIKNHMKIETPALEIVQTAPDLNLRAEQNKPSMRMR